MDSPVPVRPAGNGPEGETGTTVRYQKTGGFLKPEGALIPPPKDAVQHRMGVEVHSYDAIIDSQGNPLLETGNHTMVSIMDAVNNQESVAFCIEKQIKEDLRQAGRRCVRAAGVRSRFIHFEFLRLSQDHAYLGKKGSVVALEMNFRPSGGFTPDMINQACSTDVYRDWADMVKYDCLRDKGQAEIYYCVSVGLRDCRRYVHTPEEIHEKYADRIVLEQRLPDVLAMAMGDTIYLARFSTEEEMKVFIQFLTQEV